MVAFWFVMDADTAFAQQGNVLLEDWMAHQLHHDAWNGNYGKGSTSKVFKQQSGCQRIADALCPLVYCIESWRHHQQRLCLGELICLPWQFVVCSYHIARMFG